MLRRVRPGARTEAKVPTLCREWRCAAAIASHQMDRRPDRDLLSQYLPAFLILRRWTAARALSGCGRGVCATLIRGV